MEDPKIGIGQVPLNPDKFSRIIYDRVLNIEFLTLAVKEKTKNYQKTEIKKIMK